MAARKLQTEIDRTLKKVAEGVELFESIYDKMQASTNQTQKEKLETDLKTQIKKLQRLRDQIKTWVASNDIKDKSQLLENRRLIETQMEKFKACEKEMKTKAFSKEGLIQSAKLDPKQQEKLETTEWLQTCVEQLQLQVESAEAEIETLQGAGRKKAKANSNERLDALEHLNERRKWHISRLELIMRLLDNGTLSTERVLAVKEDVQYFVDDNSGDDYEEDEGIYDELHLEEEEEKFGRMAPEDHDSDDSDEASEDLPPRTPNKKHSHTHDDESQTSSKREESPIMKKAGASLQLRKHSTAGDARPPPPNPNFGQQPMSSVLKAGLPSSASSTATARPVVPPLPPLKYAAVATAAATGTTPATGHPPPTATSSTAVAASSSSASIMSPKVPTTPAAVPAATTPIQDQASIATTSPSLTHATTTSPFLSSASVGANADGSADSPAMSEALVGGPTVSPTRATHSPLAETLSPKVAADAQPSPSAPAPAPANGSAVPAPSAAPSPLPQQAQFLPPGVPLPSPRAPQFPPGVPVKTEQRPPSTVPSRVSSAANNAAFPGSLSDLVTSFETVKQKAPHRMANLDQVHKLLAGSYANMPQPQDTAKPRYYVPRNPYSSPPYYPQTVSRLLSSSNFFAQLDVETLFYVFYFLPGTYQQYLAAKELKRQSWRFHIKYLTWFQRHSEPQAITDEYEQGVYVYFDWEGSWCQRKKSDFRFEYRYLSED
ncbi:Not1 N-terminal domain, CCR4-Not complex component-domain-containing protein [Vararia minispora EC-137]|uniref:Not1 N-terminal domain, CCR4-Not complex component-domain-containing protein n=1 Tax=Vararia minispora EC-137 TaxID=1314806 RepID=A0ACB8QRD9_9AGAM|nr:Not1 N-terminal domain, CCR4-Not complex component-domain-containing protein [Vararia minispora EC-137]